MLRIILKRICHNEDLQIHDEALFTVDIEQPEIEALLRSGGCGNGGYERTRVIGVEVLEDGR